MTAAERLPVWRRGRRVKVWFLHKIDRGGGDYLIWIYSTYSRALAAAIRECLDFLDSVAEIGAAEDLRIRHLLQQEMLDDALEAIDGEINDELEMRIEPVEVDSDEGAPAA